MGKQEKWTRKHQAALAEVFLALGYESGDGHDRVDEKVDDAGL